MHCAIIKPGVMTTFVSNKNRSDCNIVTSSHVVRPRTWEDTGNKETKHLKEMRKGEAQFG